jgi:hypothetical protein
VRVRRDADEQLVLAHVWNKLSGLVQVLTIHIFKDDWIRRTTHQLVYNSSSNTNRSSPFSNYITPAPLAPTPSIFTSQTQNPLLISSNRKTQLNTSTIEESEYVIVSQ